MTGRTALSEEWLPCIRVAGAGFEFGLDSFHGVARPGRQGTGCFGKKLCGEGRYRYRLVTMLSQTSHRVRRNTRRLHFAALDTLEKGQAPLPTAGEQTL